MKTPASISHGSSFGSDRPFISGVPSVFANIANSQVERIVQNVAAALLEESNRSLRVAMEDSPQWHDVMDHVKFSWNGSSIYVDVEDDYADKVSELEFGALNKPANAVIRPQLLRLEKSLPKRISTALTEAVTSG